MTFAADLTDRHVLVTGASSGLGAAITRTLVECGATVVMLARRKDRLDELELELGERAIGIECDVTDLAVLEAAVEEAARRLDGLDAIIAVAGRGMVGSITTGTPQKWRELFDLNLVGPLATVHYAARHLREGRRRDVVLVGSVSAISPMPGVGIYAASKRGLRAAFDALRVELAADGVNSSLIMPGAFETEGLIGATVIDGLIDEGAMPTVVPGNTTPPPPDPVAATVAFMLSLPDGISLNEVVIRPTFQIRP